LQTASYDLSLSKLFVFKSINSDLFWLLLLNPNLAKKPKLLLMLVVIL